MRILTFLVIGCLLTSATSFADEKPPAQSDAVPPFVKAFHSIKTSCDIESREIVRKATPDLQAAERAGDVEGLNRLTLALRSEHTALYAKAARKVFEVAAPHAADRAAAELLAWVVERDDETDVGHAALALLIEHHLTRPPILDLAERHRDSGRRWAERLLRAQVAAPGLPEERRPIQTLALARCLQHACRIPTAETDELEAEAIRLYAEIGEKYADRDYRGGVTFGELAESALFETRYLKVGKVAPEIVGADLDGVPLRLSDYRGKVVMLSFWATWCGPCMAMVPFERRLADQYRNKPFALLGVNGDPAREPLKAVLEKQGLTWRSFWCGEKGPLGPIPRSWNVNVWPTVYVLDHTGVIRAKNLPESELDEIIGKLVAEAEEAFRNLQ